jgi:hypothetical protein
MGVFKDLQKSDPLGNPLESVRYPLGTRLNESQIWSREAPEVRKDFRQITVIDTEPGRECGEVLITSGSRDPSPGARIIRTSDSQNWERSISLLSMHRAAHNEVVAPPTVIAPLSIGRESPAKVAASERSDALGKAGITMLGANLVHGSLEGVHALAEFGEEIRMGSVENLTASRNIGLTGVQIVAADLAKKDLAFHSEPAESCRSTTRFNQPCNHFQLWTEARIKFGTTGRSRDLSRERNSPKTPPGWIWSPIYRVVYCAI